MGESSARKDCGQISPITDFEIEDGVFKKYLGDSETVAIPEGAVTSIGNEAFLKCEALTSIYIPNGVTSIGNYAFSECKSLSSIYIPDSATSIGNYTFSGCQSLSSIYIPDSVTSIGNYAFMRAQHFPRFRFRTA